MMLEILQWAAAVFGVMGAYLLARNNSLSRWGWVAFLVSNGFWIAYGLATAQFGLLMQQIVFTGTSLLGVYAWFLRPQKSHLA